MTNDAGQLQPANPTAFTPMGTKCHFQTWDGLFGELSHSANVGRILTFGRAMPQILLDDFTMVTQNCQPLVQRRTPAEIKKIVPTQ